jgi:TetR/AcrR family transcriptional regulator, mexJK operon transcriptional repressor
MADASPIPSLSRREARPEVRREIILNVAMQSFLKHGYAGTTMSVIAETLGGSKGTLWSYYSSKEVLLPR